MNRVETGKVGERLATQYLVRLGFKILEQNWRCRSGEVDLIGEDQDELVFVEVRTRTGQTGAFGTAEESVDLRKQRQVRRVAMVYLTMKQWHDRAIRFDLVTVRLIKNSQGHTHEITHIPHAF